MKKLINIFPSVLSGTAVSAAFFSQKYSFLVFFALVPLFISIIKNFKIYKIFIYALSMYTTSLCWLISSVSMLTDNALLHFIISAFLIAAVSVILSVMLILPFCVFRFSTYSETKSMLLFPFIYILGEWLQGAFHSFAFPWIRLGNIASPFTAFIQSASVFGTLFISLLIIYINVFIALFICSVKKSHKFIISAASIAILNISWGYYRLDSTHEKNLDTKQTAIIVQGNYPKNAKSDSRPEDILEKYLELTYSCPEKKSDLILFPETAMHSMIYKTKDMRKKLCALCSDFDSMLLFGSQYDTKDKYYNACMAVTPYSIPENSIDAVYLKRILVPGGEYTPFGLKLSLPDFSAGTRCTLIGSPEGQIGCNICFESVFPDAASECVRKGAQVITVLTNDSWLGEVIPLYQHHSHSVMRAVENGRYVLTSTNTGISSIIDDMGNIKEKSDINTEAAIQGSYYLRSNITPYTKYGDIIILPSCFILFYSAVRFILLRQQGNRMKKTGRFV